jgi:hypothetical protein
MRTKTPPLLKWLLVERATVAGGISRTRERQELLTKELESSRARLVSLSQEIAHLQSRSAVLVQSLAEQQHCLSAMDSTMALVDSSVAPNAAGIVRATGQRYGGRGALKAFIVSTLRDAAPATLQTRLLAWTSAVHFGLDFASQAEFEAFANNSVRPQIFRLTEQGLVERVRNGQKSENHCNWRWKNQLPTLAELAALVAASA